MKLNSLPNDKISDWPKWKAFADNKIDATEKLNFVLGWGENILGKGENAGNHHFSFSHNVFSKGFFLRVIKSQDCVVKG